MRILCAAAWLSLATADMMDVMLPHYVPPAECAHGCAAWSAYPSTHALFAAGVPPPNASNFCAIPAAAVDEQTSINATVHCGGPKLGDLVFNGSTSSFYGPICACAPAAADAPLTFATCTAPRNFPEQVNLQIAASHTVVVSFVTFEAAQPAASPTAQLREAGSSTLWPAGAAAASHTGVAHRYTTSHQAASQFCSESLPSSIHCLRRNYTMSFVRLSGLKPRQVRCNANLMLCYSC